MASNQTVFGIDVGLVREQQFGEIFVPINHRNVQGRFGPLACGIDISSFVNKIIGN